MDEKTYVTSDLHIGHNKEYVYKARGFDSIKSHDKVLLDRWNSIVKKEDKIFLLGDVIMNDTVYGLKVLEQLNGSITIVRGNHDTERKLEYYQTCSNIDEIVDAKYFRMGKLTFYMSHYPTLVSHKTLKSLKHALINLYGHTHQKTNFFDDGVQGFHPYMYHVGVDSHNLQPVLLEGIIEEIRIAKNEYDNPRFPVTFKPKEKPEIKS